MFAAGEIRILYSQSRMRRMARLAKVGPITVSNVTAILSRHMTTVECDVFGYLSIEDDLVLIIMPVVKDPTQIQVNIFSIRVRTDPQMFLNLYIIFKYS